MTLSLKVVRCLLIWSWTDWVASPHRPAPSHPIPFWHMFDVWLCFVNSLLPRNLSRVSWVWICVSVSILFKCTSFTKRTMIKAILVFNNHGKPRLSKFYQYFVSWLCVSFHDCFNQCLIFNHFSLQGICSHFLSRINTLQSMYLENNLTIFIPYFEVLFIMYRNFFQNEDMQQQIIKETFQLVSKRDDNVCNFLEGGRWASIGLLISII